VRRDDDAGSTSSELSRCASPAGASPAPVSVGAPGSRSPEPSESSEAEARRQEPEQIGRQGRGPQHEVKLAASTELQPGSRAAHVTAKATSSTKRSEYFVEDSRGVWSAARVQGKARNTGDPSAQPRVRGTRTDQAEGQAIAVQRKSEGIIVPTRAAPQNAAGGKDPCHIVLDGAGSRNDKGMVEARVVGNPSHRRPNSPNRSSSVDNVERLQRRLGAAAKRNGGRRFHALFDRIWRRDVLQKAWDRVKRNKGAAGVDAETIASIRALGEESFLNDLSKTLRAGRYRPQAVRRHWIPKSNGGRRPLGIPTVRDRVVQAAAKLVLEPIFEVDFVECSHGFRPGRSATGALEKLRLRSSGNKGNHVFDADIRDFFGSLDREILMKRVQLRVSDRRVLSLIRQWLEAGVMDDGREIRMLSGTPQGGVISPLLSNIYLAFLDERWTKQCAHVGTLVRYCDDFVIVCDSKKNVDEAERRVKLIFARLRLELHPDKTRKVDLSQGRQGFDFLGCHLHKRMSGRIWENERKRVYFLQRWPSKTSVKRVKQRVKELTPNAACHRDLRETIATINPAIRGWGGYFATGNASTKFNQVDGYVWARLRKLMRRRKGRNLKAGEMRRWTRQAFHKLGLHQLLGTVRYPGKAQLPRPERSPVSRVREIRTHGLNGGLAHSRRKTEEG
jgi:RNA-directed DNA polymerase